MRSTTPEQRFRAKTNTETSQTFYGGTRCHEWQGYIAPNGYGNFRLAGRTEYTHRQAWIFAYGPFLKGLHVLHHCDNRRCVNPDHLFLGSRDDNMADMFAKKREARGTRLPQSKIDETDVLAIRLSKEKQAVLAERYGLTQGQISMIKSGKSWSHV